jgi:hypothetical protein
MLTMITKLLPSIHPIVLFSPFFAAVKILQFRVYQNFDAANAVKKTLWFSTGVALFCTGIHCIKKVSVRHFQAISKWKLAFTFGAHLAGLRFVERYFEEPNDAMNALCILQTMVKTDRHIHKLVVELGGIETSVKVIKKFGDRNEGVAVSGVGLIQAICGYNNATDQKLLECGAIRVIVQVTRHWPENEVLQANACKALDRLASNKDVSIQKKIIDVGGLVALAEARTRHQNDERVYKPATHAILLLVSQGLEPVQTPYDDPIVFWKSLV